MFRWRTRETALAKTSAVKTKNKQKRTERIWRMSITIGHDPVDLNAQRHDDMKRKQGLKRKVLVVCYLSQIFSCVVRVGSGICCLSSSVCRRVPAFIIMSLIDYTYSFVCLHWFKQKMYSFIVIISLTNKYRKHKSSMLI